MKNTFVNAQEQHFKNPDTFAAPSYEELSSLKVGAIVKVATGGERFWVTVTAKDADLLTGTIDNNLVLTEKHGLSYGDEITFTLHHIFDIIP